MQAIAFLNNKFNLLWSDSNCTLKFNLKSSFLTFVVKSWLNANPDSYREFSIIKNSIIRNYNLFLKEIFLGDGFIYFVEKENYE